MTELKPYTGPYSGRLYHVVTNGKVVRNATDLEVAMWERIANLEGHIKAIALSTVEKLGPAAPLS